MTYLNTLFRAAFEGATSNFLEDLILAILSMIFFWLPGQAG